MHKKLKNFHKKFTSLTNVVPQTETNKNLKEKVLDDAGDLFNDLYYIYKDKYNEEINSLDTENRKKFDYKKLRLTDDYLYLSEEEQLTSKEFNKKESPKKPAKTDFDELNDQIIKEETEINQELFKNYFKFQKPSAMFKNLYNLNNKNKNNELVNVIKSVLSDFKDKIKNISEEEKETGKPYRIVDIAEKILKFNKKKKKKQEEGLKILTPSQMFHRLAIALAQLKAGNNSEKLKNKIRQLLYFLYRSKKLTTNIYKSLIDII